MFSVYEKKQSPDLAFFSLEAWVSVSLINKNLIRVYSKSIE